MISAESLRALYRPQPVEPAAPAAPGPRFVVVTCMDRRLRPEESLGLSTGGARVVRNAGGRVSDDVLRSLIVAWSELGAGEFVVVHHTDCALGKQTNEDLQRAVTTASGTDASRLDFLAFTDPERSVRDDVERIRSCEFIPGDVAVVGFLCDTDRGSLQLIVGDRLSQLPFARPTLSPRHAGESRAEPPRSTGFTIPTAPPAAPPAASPAVPTGLGELGTLAALPPPPVFQPAPPTPPTPPSRPRRGRAVIAVAGFLTVVGFIVASIVNGHTNTSSGDQTPPSIDVTSPPITAPSPAPTAPVPTTVPAPAPPATTAIAVQDPLSAPKTFAAAPGDPNANSTFVDGGFQLFVGDGYYDVESPGDLRSVTGHRQEPNLDIEVTATKVRGGNANYGIGCRLSSDANSGYYLMINSDRNAEIDRWSTGHAEQVLASSTAPTDVINPGTAPNIVRGICTGGAGQPAHLGLIVNGRVVLDATDTRHPYGPDGTLGLAVDSSGTNAGGSSTGVRFNNFTARTG
jgi:carbonic anhydrase